MISGNPLAAELLKPAPPTDHWRWGTIVATNPVRVLLGGDREASAATPDCLVTVQTGDKVRVHIVNRKMVIVGRQVKSHAVVPDPVGGEVVIGGTAYPTSGVVNSPGWTVALTDGSFYTGNLDVDVPFTPPDGWTFAWSIQQTRGYTFLSNADREPVLGKMKLRVMQVGSNSVTVLNRLAWQLIKL